MHGRRSCQRCETCGSCCCCCCCGCAFGAFGQSPRAPLLQQSLHDSFWLRSERKALQAPATPKSGRTVVQPHAAESLWTSCPSSWGSRHHPREHSGGIAVPASSLSLAANECGAGGHHDVDGDAGSQFRDRPPAAQRPGPGQLEDCHFRPALLVRHPSLPLRRKQQHRQ